MSVPAGWMKNGEFVCRDCATDDDRERALRTDDRMASGRECARCGDVMPYEVVVRLLPDGAHSTRVPRVIRDGERIVTLERREHVLVDEDALVYVMVGTHREVGLRVTPVGVLEVWVHDDPYGDGDGAEPTARWTHDPAQSIGQPEVSEWCAYEGCQEPPTGYDAEADEHYCAKHEGPF